jgi:signal peptidase II
MKKNPFARRPAPLVLKVAATVVAADALSKAWALHALDATPPAAPVTGSWLGTAAGPVQAVLDLLVITAVAALARRITSPPWAVVAGLAAGAAAGDLIDRLARPPGPLRGALVHWIDTPLVAFNLADVAVVVAATLALSLRGRH